ncbi:SpoIID/LytB domain-containing protein [Oryzihumus leptocrescens]|uniref:SpoIID/LytB domain protein n=1 Tax=Oryzihumus leptocrescens TaxID=297536 RepID=A0A542ZGA3_9MICO|nr:SpoIID/LytB domain-containing protein [Oryzihumus leptocrescens]TQL59365.1 SpoIID/LytB domain protein [Oryzihumus leptocrescens]
MSLANSTKRPGVRRSRLVGAAVVGAALALGSLVTAGSARASEVYPRPYTGVITVAGHGWGHGHGMSQYGAFGAAQQGLTWQQIIGFYYNNAPVISIGNPTIRVQLSAPATATTTVTADSSLAASFGSGHTGTMSLVTKEGNGNTIAAYRVANLGNGTAALQYVLSDWKTWKTWKTDPAQINISSSAGALTTTSSGVYRGELRGIVSGSSSLTSVLALSMDNYLRRVVPSESSASWPLAALQAQAVAARSYAGYYLDNPRSASYDICGTDYCQVFGAAKEYPSTDQAVADTSGQVISDGGKAAFAEFSSSNGGWAVAVAGKSYLVAHPDPYDGAALTSSGARANPNIAWTASVPVSSVEAAVNAWLSKRNKPSIGSYVSLTVTSRDGNGDWGGRITQAVIQGSKGSAAVPGDTLRGLLGLKSEWFVPTNPPNPRSAPSYPRDFTGDYKADVLAAVGTTGELRLYAGNGAGGWQPTQVIDSAGWNTFAKVFTAGTWDADAISDVMAQKADGTLWLYPGTTSGALGAPRQIGTGWTMHNLVFPVGDFNGDGMTDLLARRASDGALMLYTGDSQGGFTGSRQVGAGWNVFSTVFGPGDLTGDGKADVLARAKDGTLYLYPGNGSGGWLPRRVVGHGWNAFSSIIGPGDFSGDGRNDVLARTWDGSLYLYPGTGSGGWGARRLVGSGWQIFSTILP